MLSKHAAIRRPWPWFCAVLSGLLLTLAYAPFNQSWVVWIGLTPVVAAILFGPRAERRPFPRWFLLGYVAGLVYFLGSLHWLTTVTVGGWAALSFYLALFPGVWAALTGIFARAACDVSGERPVWLSSRRNLLLAVFAAASWTGLEWLRGILFSGFGWNGLGVALHANVAMIQVADLTGVGGLSFLIVMVNMIALLTIKRLWMETRRGAMRPHYDFGLTLALVALVFIYGIHRLTKDETETKPLTVAAVQANIPQYQKWDPEFQRRIHETYAHHTGVAAAVDPDLIAWPEAATPRAVFSDRLNWNLVHGLAQTFNGDFLLGTVHFDETGDYNSVLLLTGQAERAQLYHKLHLVPFGEFVPFRESFPLFAWIVGDLVPSDFDHGSEFTILETQRNPVRIAPLICFEDTLGRLARRFVERGAQLFVVVTNDGWFLESAGSEQHLSHAVFRSAEAKIPMVRAANTGVTCFVDRHGQVVSRLEDGDGRTFIEGVLTGVVEVPVDPRPTVYSRIGESFSVACLMLAGVWGFVCLWRANPAATART